MYIIKTCRPKEDLAQRYPPVVTTAVCRLCGERVRLSPIEVLTNRIGIPFSIRRMNEMEDQYDDSNEEKSDSDEAADDEYDGACGMCPPSDESPDAEECGDDEIPLEADLWIQVHVHLTIHRDRQNK